MKYNWRDEVITAIRDQLGIRYLQRPHGTAGVYVAVFFSGSAWETTDSGRAKAAHHMDQLHASLHSHAAALLNVGSPPTFASSTPPGSRP